MVLLVNARSAGTHWLSPRKKKKREETSLYSSLVTITISHNAYLFFCLFGFLLLFPALFLLHGAFPLSDISIPFFPIKSFYCENKTDQTLLGYYSKVHAITWIMKTVNTVKWKINPPPSQNLASYLAENGRNFSQDKGCTKREKYSVWKLRTKKKPIQSSEHLLSYLEEWTLNVFLNMWNWASQRNLAVLISSTLQILKFF